MSLQHYMPSLSLHTNKRHENVIRLSRNHTCLGVQKALNHSWWMLYSDHISAWHPNIDCRYHKHRRDVLANASILRSCAFRLSGTYLQAKWLFSHTHSLLSISLMLNAKHLFAHCRVCHMHLVYFPVWIAASFPPDKGGLCSDACVFIADSGHIQYGEQLSHCFSSCCSWLRINSGSEWK